MATIYLFGDCRLDPARRELVRGEQVEAVEPQVLDLILDLIEHRDRIVMRCELHDRIWHGRIVSEATLSGRVKMARRAIGDNGREQALIRTIHGRGFRFVGAVRVVDDLGDTAAAPEPALPQNHSRNADPPAERRQLTIVSCALTDLALLPGDPEEIDEFLGRAVATLVATFETWGGYVAQTYPAGVLVYFGWPRALEDTARLAVRAALAIEPALRDLQWSGAPPQARTGVATGVVIVGGSGAPRFGRAGGGAALLADRLMGLANPGEIIVADSTRDLLGKGFVLEEQTAEPVAEPGRGTRLWRVVRAADVLTRFEAATRHALTPLVGRGEEMALLQRRWERAASGDGQVVIVTGDAGIGKSRLVHEFTLGLRPSTYWILTCQCSPEYEHSPLSPVIRALEHAARPERNDHDSARVEKIRQLFARAGQWSADTPASTIELVSAVGSAPSAAPAVQQQELVFEALVEIVEASARNRPVLFILEDAHWIDPTTQELMHRIVDLASTVPILVLVTHHPGYKAPCAGRPHVSQLSLSRLTAREVSLMADHLAGDRYLSDGLRTQIAVRTDGVPLYVEELTRMILGSRPPAEAAPSLSLPSTTADEIPATLWNLLLSHLDQLGEAREIARIGAAIGRSFRYQLLYEVAGLPGDALDDALNRLIASELVFATGTQPRAQFVFKHALVRDAAYQGLTRDRRQDLHARIAAVEGGIFDTLAMEPELRAQRPASQGFDDDGRGGGLYEAGRLRRRSATAGDRAPMLITARQDVGSVQVTLNPDPRSPPREQLSNSCPANDLGFQ